MKRGKKAQLTIFIILAILIVAIVLFIFLFWPKLKPEYNETQTPYSFFEECIEDSIEEKIETISINGGDYEVNPGTALFYRGDYIKFLCYTRNYNELCHIQVLFLKNYFENQVSTTIHPEVEGCFDALIRTYEEQGYIVSVTEGGIETKILPENVQLTFNRKVTITKDGVTQEYEEFRIREESNLFGIIEIAENIVLWEEGVGEAFPEGYMAVDPYMKVELKTVGDVPNDDSHLYIITDRRTGEVFRFASRSLAAPPGYM